MKLCKCVLVCIGLMLSSGVIAATVAPNYHLVKSIAVGGDGGWDCLTMDSSSHRLYIARSNRVTVVDVKKGVVVGEVAKTQGVHGVALVPSLNRGFASNGGDDSVTVFDLRTLKEINRVKVGNRPDIMIFDPASNRIFSFNGGSQDATAIDAATMEVAGTVRLGGKPEFAVADGKGRIFVNLEDKSEIVKFDSNTLTVKSRWSLAPGEEPTGLGIDTKHHRLFSACANETMVVSDSISGRVVTTFPIGKGPDGAGFDAKTGLAFSPNGQDGTLTVAHEDSPDKFSVLQTVPTQVSARTMALDSKTHQVCLAAARFVPQPPAKPGAPRRRPNVEPNSFVVLVFGM
jgi:DNA-binding beta-propeller fold protein YncE